MTEIKVGNLTAEGFIPNGTIIDPNAVDDYINPKLATKANAASLATKLDATTAATTYATLRPQAPAYTGGPASRAKTYNRGLNLYNGESPTMRTIRNIIRDARFNGARKRLVIAGDSKTAGSGSTQPQVATNSVPGQLSDLLNAKPGFIYGNTWDTRWGSRTNVVDVGGTSQNYLLGTGSFSVTFTSLAAFTGFKVFAYISAGGTINVTVDGVAQTAFTVASGSTWKVASYTGLTDATHTIVFSGSAGASILGIEPTYATGLTISNAGRPSSSAAEWLYTTDWSRIYSSTFAVNNASLTPSKPDAAIINIGTNTNTSTLDDITSFITNVKNLSIPTLITVFGGVGSAGNYDSKKVRLYDIADSLDLPLLDYNALIGDNTAATAAGLMTDTVHENTRGYQLEADALARVLTY